ncbi:MAG TPA: hypothetical protein VIQ60_00590, partial [Gemmatimonadaceae bacterium]
RFRARATVLFFLVTLFLVTLFLVALFFAVALFFRAVAPPSFRAVVLRFLPVALFFDAVLLFFVAAARFLGAALRFDVERAAEPPLRAALRVFVALRAADFRPADFALEFPRDDFLVVAIHVLRVRR